VEELEKKPPFKAVAVRRGSGYGMDDEVLAVASGPAAEAMVERAREQGLEVHRDPDLVEQMTTGAIPRRIYEVVAEVVSFVAQLAQLVRDAPVNQDGAAGPDDPAGIPARQEQGIQIHMEVE